MSEVRRLNAIYTWGDNVPDPLIYFEKSKLPSDLIENIGVFFVFRPFSKGNKCKIVGVWHHRTVSDSNAVDSGYGEET